MCTRTTMWASFGRRHVHERSHPRDDMFQAHTRPNERVRALAGELGGAVADPGRLPRAFWLLFGATLIARTGFFVESFLTIYMKSDAGFSPSGASLVMALYGAGGAVTTLLSGPLIDRLGPKKVLTIALTATALAAGFLALHPPSWFVAPIVLGIGSFGQVIMPASNALVAERVPRVRQRRAFSLMFVALNAGLAVGPLIGGWLSSASFPAMFAVGMALILLGALLSSRIKPGETVATGGPDKPARASALLGGFAVVRRDRLFLVFVVTNCLFMGVYLQVFVTLPLLMVADGLGPADYGTLMAMNGALLVLLQLPVDRLLKRFRLAPLLVVGAVFLTVGIGLNAVASSLWAYCLVALLWTAGELINMPIAASVTAGIAHPEHRGLYLACHGLAFPVGMTIASLFGSFALAHFSDPKLLWVFASVMGVGVVALRIVTARTIGKRLAEPVG